eukprot:gnl/TRDRNA2_/TRDRNA2_199553_c0_seq1.p1 gnl/TRDRNA2_/TRDRNA2_199553_c0~~gnl/TRDRNA2_/TRDRNA2_199553_c0_seq1.p1  ORF type:complete len:235 (+),score=33.22 gnl/TRDRNA2_/TRDRNA2_199553_c0_seq1:302-1006(+)
MPIFECCCTPPGQAGEVKDGVPPGGNAEMLDISASENPGSMQVSAKPQFPNKGQREGGINGESKVASLPSSSSSPRPQSSRMSPRGRDLEKARLQEIVKDFMRQAVSGIKVRLIDCTTAKVTSHLFQVDKYLTTITVTPSSETEADSKPPAVATLDDGTKRFNLKDLNSIYKGQDVMFKAPSLGPFAQVVMGIDTDGPEGVRLYFHFQDSVERDQFYTCLKILRMSADVGTPRK